MRTLIKNGRVVTAVDDYKADILIEGETISVIGAKLEMEVDLSCDRQSVLRNAGRGFWYDAMACLCSLIDSNPSDQTLRRQRAGLLNQIGLAKVAEWDLRSIQAPVR